MIVIKEADASKYTCPMSMNKAVENIARCQGKECMAWTWRKDENPSNYNYPKIDSTQYGYCGMANKNG